MKLKNFIKKTPPEKVKENKTFLTSIKSKRKHFRIDQKEKHKSSRRTKLLMLVSIGLFFAAIVLFLGAYFYSNILMPKISSGNIVSPGRQNIIEIEKARILIRNKDISIEKFEYSSGSGALTLKIENGPEVFISNTIPIEDQVSLLDKILRSLKNEGKNASIIDLRYNRPIVKF